MPDKSKCEIRKMFSLFRKSLADKKGNELDHALWVAERSPPRTTPLVRANQGRDQEFFEITLWMQPYLNMRSGDRWCFDEQDTIYCTLFTYDMPATGRSFDVRFGAQSLGKLEVQAGWEEIRIALRIRFVEKMLFDDLFNLVFMLALSVKGEVNIEDAKNAAATEANTALLRCLWEASQSEAVRTLECMFSGTGAHFHKYVKHWAANGIDPWRDWAGDRPN
jgi:hypothetical protein